MAEAGAEQRNQSWAEVLRRIGVALDDCPVTLVEVDDAGDVRALAASARAPLPTTATRELAPLLHRWRCRDSMRRMWVAGRADGAGWCAAPVRADPPRPPPGANERRGRVRLALELAALCVGSLDHHAILSRYAAIVDSANDAIIGKDLDGTITDWNRAAEALYGYTAAEAIGQPIAIIMPPEHPDELPGIMERLRRGERVEKYETTRVRKDGTRVNVEVTVSPVLDESGVPIGASSIAHDITSRKQTEAQLLHGALHDGLTDLPNRTYFTERLAQALGRQRRDPDYRYAVLFLDFDDFKLVNDSLGHAAGDTLLNDIAQRLILCLRPGDLVARLGGDEFAVLLDDVSGIADAEQAAHRLERCLHPPFVVDGHDLSISASVGVALGGPGYNRPADLLRDADIAMYRAKAQGPGRFRVFDVAMREWAYARFSIETDLRGALDRAELRLVFQPIVHLATGEPYGVEALLRWHHPTRGDLPPVDFLQLAEHSGRIVPMGRWVLREACRHARCWALQFPRLGPLRIAVNMSAVELREPQFLEHVREVIRETGLDPALLDLEIAEAALEHGAASETARATLDALRATGVGLLADDFGTGHSSLASLSRLQLSGIKVDRAFVRRLGDRRTDNEIVRAIVELAGNLNLRVVAEGIETQAQRDRLIAVGCTLGQGYYFTRPLEAAALADLLRTARRTTR